MKNKLSLFSTLIITFLLTTCSTIKTKKWITVQLSNPLEIPLHDYTAEINMDTTILAIAGIPENLEAVSDGEIIPFQWIKATPENPCHRFFIQTDLPANTSQSIYLKPGDADSSIFFTKKTHAEIWYKTGGYFKDKVYTGGEFKPFRSLRVPDECTDHSYYIKYEGPGWESDKVGYRLYLDWRNAIDIYGKKVNAMVLSGVGLDGYESYHEMSDWGMDILKVGPSLGIGTIGYWNGEYAERVAETDSVYCEIVTDGDLYSEILIKYSGWKIAEKSVGLESILSITAGSRATHHVVSLDIDLNNLCTGIVKSEGVDLFTGDSTLEWNYIATWGNQSLAGDSLGMAVIFPTDNLQEITEDENSYVAVLNPKNKQVDYYFLAAWEQEPLGIKNLTDFKNYLNDFSVQLSKPIAIEVIKN